MRAPRSNAQDAPRAMAPPPRAVAAPEDDGGAVKPWVLREELEAIGVFLPIDATLLLTDKPPPTMPFAFGFGDGFGGLHNGDADAAAEAPAPAMGIAVAAEDAAPQDAKAPPPIILSPGLKFDLDDAGGNDGGTDDDEGNSKPVAAAPDAEPAKRLTAVELFAKCVTDRLTAHARQRNSRVVCQNGALSRAASVTSPLSSHRAALTPTQMYVVVRRRAPL